MSEKSSVTVLHDDQDGGPLIPLLLPLHNAIVDDDDGYTATTATAITLNNKDDNCMMTVVLVLLLVLHMMVILTTTRMIRFFVPPDRFGRKRALMLSLLIHVGCAIGTAFSPSFAVFVTLRFFVGLGNLGTFLTAYTLGENQRVSLFPITALPSSTPPPPPSYSSLLFDVFAILCEDFGRMFDNSFPACAFFKILFSGD